jgi:Ca2+-binding EF-hand superfamily protein
VEEAFIQKLFVCMDYSRESLFELMSEYDFDQEGSIETKDLIKVLKKLGIMNPEPHISTLLRVGGCS